MSTFSRAAAGAPAVVPNDTVEVRAERVDSLEAIRRLPFFASVKDLSDAPGRLVTIADVLEESAGVRVRRFGGLGAYTLLSIRGSAPGQVEIYLDGIPLNSAEWGAADLSEIPVDNLLRAEVYRSGGPSSLGALGIGGAVNLVTRPTGAARTSIALTAGSYDTWKTYALRSGVLGGTAYLLSYRQVRSKGDFPFTYDPGTRFQNASDDTVLTRTNNAFREHALLGKLRLPPLGGWDLEARDDWYLKEGGFPGHGNLIYEEASFDHRRNRFGLSAASPPFLGDRLRARLAAHRVDSEDRYANPGKEPTLHLSDLVYRSANTGGKGEVAARTFGGRNETRAAADGRIERFEPEDENPAIGKGPAGERRVASLALENDLRLLGDRLSLFGSVRWTESEDDFRGASPLESEIPAPGSDERSHRSALRDPTVGARAAIGRLLTVRASRTRTSRLPTLFELFGTNGDVRPNPSLAPEKATTWDAGLRMVSPASAALAGSPVVGTLDLSAFHSERDSLIVFIQNSQQVFKAMNLERATAMGVEAEWEIAWRRFQVDGSFTTQDVRQHGEVPHWENAWVPYVSPRELFIRTRIRLGSVELRHELSYFDRYYRDRANTEVDRAPARTVHDLGARARVLDGRVSLDLDLRNAGDDKSQDSFGYPMPGRTVYFTISYDIEGKRR